MLGVWQEGEGGAESWNLLEETHQLVGLQADVTNFENWESDFELGGSKVDSSKKTLQLSLPASTDPPIPLVNPSLPSLLSASEKRDLEELLSTLPQLPCTDPPLTPPAMKIKLNFKDLLALIRKTSPSAQHKSAERRRAGVESKEWDLTEARGKGGVHQQASAHMELARSYRASGQTGAAMIQLQHALKLLSSEVPPGVGREEEEGLGLDGSVHEAHVLYEMAVTSRLIQDLSAAKGYLTRAIQREALAGSLSPLWSSLQLQLHLESGKVLLAMGEAKSAMWYLTRYVAGLVARPAPSNDGSGLGLWCKFHSDLSLGCLYLGATLLCEGYCDLAVSFLRKSAGACELLLAGIEDVAQIIDSGLSRVTTWLAAAINGAEKGSNTLEERVAAASEGTDDQCEEEEDWDKELEIEKQGKDSIAARPSLADVFHRAWVPPQSKSMLGGGIEVLAEKHQLAGQVTGQAARPVIIMFPKATGLFALKSRRAISEAAAQLWLETLVSAR